jgi:hypothetical protein
MASHVCIRIAILLMIGLQLVTIIPASAEGFGRPRSSLKAEELPFARSERAQRVWDSGACWSACGAYCAWGQAQCLQTDRQDECLALTDRCDRLCQRRCRAGAGPYLPID